VIEKSRISASFDELATRLGWSGDVGDLVEVVSSLVPGAEDLMERCEMEREMRSCAQQGDTSGRLTARKRLLELTCSILDMGYGLPVLLGTPSSNVVPPLESPETLSTECMDAKKVSKKKAVKKALKVSKTSKTSDVIPVISARKKRAPVEMDRGSILVNLKCRSDLTDDQLVELRKLLPTVPSKLVGCEPMQDDVLGYYQVNGVQDCYHSRSKIVVVLRPRLFGAEVVDKRSVRIMTLHKGVLNHCELNDHPSPYWAALDVMSDLVKFNKAQVIKESIRLYGVVRNKAKYSTVKSYELGLNWAYDVLKTHQRHPSKCHSGMSHIVEDCGGSERGSSAIRGRKDYETLEYFMEQRAKRAEAKQAGKPFVSIEHRAV